MFQVAQRGADGRRTTPRSSPRWRRAVTASSRTTARCAVVATAAAVAVAAVAVDGGRGGGGGGNGGGGGGAAAAVAVAAVAVAADAVDAVMMATAVMGAATDGHVTRATVFKWRPRPA